MAKQTIFYTPLAFLSDLYYIYSYGPSNIYMTIQDMKQNSFPDNMLLSNNDLKDLQTTKEKKGNKLIITDTFTIYKVPFKTIRIFNLVNNAYILSSEIEPSYLEYRRGKLITIRWYKDGFVYRDGGPSAIYNYGDRKLYAFTDTSGRFHNDAYPAIIEVCERFIYDKDKKKKPKKTIEINKRYVWHGKKINDKIKISEKGIKLYGADWFFHDQLMDDIILEKQWNLILPKEEKESTLKPA